MADHHVIYARVSTQEFERLRRYAERDGFESVAAYVRSCVNDRLAEESDDATLLTDQRRGRPPLRMAKAGIHP